MTKSKLPPLPPHPEPMVMKWSPLERAAIRARDIEVAKAVLEAAATWYNDEGRELCRSDVAAELRALEVSHD